LSEVGLSNIFNRTSPLTNGITTRVSFGIVDPLLDGTINFSRDILLLFLNFLLRELLYSLNALSIINFDYRDCMRTVILSQFFELLTDHDEAVK